MEDEKKPVPPVTVKADWTKEPPSKLAEVNRRMRLGVCPLPH